MYGLLPTGNTLQLESLSRQSDIHGPPLPFVALEIMNQRTVTCGLLGVEFLTRRYLLQGYQKSQPHLEGDCEGDCLFLVFPLIPKVILNLDMASICRSIMR